jgi:hypothetical protein
MANPLRLPFDFPPNGTPTTHQLQANFNALLKFVQDLNDGVEALGNLLVDTLTTTSTATIGGALTASGAATVAGALNANGTATVAGALTANTTATVAGLLTASGAATVGGALTANSATVSGALNANGTATVAGALTANSTATVAGLLTASGAATVTGALTANSTATVAGLLTASGAATVTGALTANSTATVAGLLTASGAATVAGALTAQTTATVTGALTANSTATVAGALSANGTATVAGVLTANSTSALNGAVTAGSTLTATGDITASATVKLANGSAGTPSLRFTNSGSAGLYRVGADKIGIVTNSVKVWDGDSSGNITLPVQPAFLVTMTTGGANTFGDGPAYTVDWDNETLDRSSAFNMTTNTFTAAVDGVYAFVCFLDTSSVNVSPILPTVTIVTSNQSYFNNLPAYTSASCRGLTVVYTFMDANDTAYVTIAGNSLLATKTADIDSGYFAGFLFG